MKMMKLGRTLVAVLLVCALLFSWSPVKAQAMTGFEAAIFYLGWTLVLIPVVIGLGISIGKVVDDFNNMIAALGSDLETAGYITDGQIPVYYHDGKTYVDPDLPQFVKDWIWSEGILIDGSSIPENYLTNSGFMEWYDSYVSNYKYVVAFWGTNSCTLCLTNIAPFLLTSGSDWDGSYTGCSISGYPNSSFNYYQYYLSTNTGSGVFTDTYYKGRSPYSVVGVDSASAVDTSYDLTLGDVAGQDEDLATGYPEWAGQSVALTPSGTDTVITGYPVSTPSTYEEAISQTQTEAQSGTTSITDSDIGSDVVVEGLDVPLAEVNTISFIDALGLSDLLVTMQGLPDAVGAQFVDALTAVFVPSADYLTNKVESLGERFDFIPSITKTGEFLRDSVSGASGPPVIYVDLGAADGDINYGGKVLLTDFSWYEPYKPTVDSVLGAACWAFFGWRVFMRLPGIIGGESGYVESAVSLYDFHKSARDNDSPKKKKGR